MDGFDRTQRALEGPAWRWTRAQRLARATAPESVEAFQGQADGLICQAAAYLQGCQPGPQAQGNAARDYPLIAAARALWKQPALRDQFKFLTVAGCSQQEIAQLSGVAAEVVDVCERLFFDVRGWGEASVWVVCHVIEPEVRAGNTALASRLRLALYAGPALARRLVQLDCQLPVNEAERVAALQMQLQLKLDQALTVPLEAPADTVRYVKLYLEHKVGLQRLEVAKRRLQQRCDEAVRRHEVAQRRQALAERREEQRQAERTRREASRRARDEAAGRDWQARQQAYLARQLAAQQRAASSPLAGLRWADPKGAPPPGTTAGPQADAGVAMSAAVPPGSTRAGLPGGWPGPEGSRGRQAERQCPQIETTSMPRKRPNPEHVRLLHGPYAAPALKRGDKATCLFRDCDVIITSWSDARISWPRCRRPDTRGGSGLLVNEELARAVRCESALAIRYWWGPAAWPSGTGGKRSACRSSMKGQPSC